jgi:endoglucanase
MESLAIKGDVILARRMRGALRMADLNSSDYRCRRIRFAVAVHCALFSVFSSQLVAAADQRLSFISASGSRLVDSGGSQVILKGCNLGNYLMLESWMFGKTMGVGPDHAFRDGASVYGTLRRRFGEEQSEHLIELYRDNWVTPRDFAIIKTFGFNVVRLPFDYRQIQDDQASFGVKENAFHWLDRAVDMAKDAGIYVILDLHGTPGGQSLEDHTGVAGQDHLWTSNEDQRRTVQVWKALAEHFKDRSAVAAYDLINEPYGNHTEDCRPVLARLLPEIYQAIRSTGDQHVVFFPGALNGGISFYGNPHDQGMTNVAFTEHYYPGMFGGKTALETQARVLNQQLPAKYAYVNEIASPYFVGEFNVVLESEDPCRVMRAYYDRFAEYDWPCTMWAYKMLSTSGGVHPSAWCMVTNANPLPPLDLDSSSYKDFENFFTDLGTMPLATNERLLDALTTPHPPALYLADYPSLPAAPPGDPGSEPDGFSSIDIGGASPGYTQALADGSVLVMGGGSDIFGAGDSCRFVSQPVAGNSVDMRAAILSLVDSAEFAKAGVMARWGDPKDSHSAMAMVNVFPDGTVALVTRPRAGRRAVETKVGASAQFPVELRLQISQGRATGSYRTDRGDWQTIGSGEVPAQGEFRVGLAVCAHLDAGLTTVKARLGSAADDALPAPGETANIAPSGPSFLANGSFEEQGGAADLAADWNRWGDWMNRETGWSPTHSGSCEIGYHHWQITSADTSGLWQDVNAQPGKRYTFSIYAQHDVSAAGQSDASNVELRLETVTDHGELTLNTQNFEVNRLASGNAWTRLSLSGTADGPRMRVLVVITPSPAGPRGGAIKLDDAALMLQPTLPEPRAPAAQLP